MTPVKSESLRRIFLLSAHAALGALIIISTAWGIADLSALKPRALLYLLEEQLSSPHEADLKSAVSDMSLAARWNPNDPYIMFDLGALFEWQALGKRAWSKEARESRKEAINHFRVAAYLRPSWSSAWAQLAYCKALNQELDNEAFDALEKAMVFGPWKPMIHMKVIWVGLAAWDHLPPRQRESLVRHIRRALSDQGQGEYVIQVSVDLGRDDVIRPLIEEPWAMQAFAKFQQRRGTSGRQ